MIRSWLVLAVVYIAALVAAAGCKTVKPVAPVGSQAGEGAAAAEALTKSAEQNNQRLKPFVKAPGKPLSEAMTDDHVGAIEAINQARIQIGLLQTNAAALYGHVIEERANVRLERQRGQDALKAERSHLFSYQMRIAAIALLVIVVVWQIAAQWLSVGTSPLGIVFRILKRFI